MMTRAVISRGSVMHARHATANNHFSYGIFTLCLPLSGLANLKVAGLGINRFNLMSVLERDHGPRDGSPLLPWIRAVLAMHGLDEVADGEVVLQTMPRLCGYAFNPVSFWYCLDKQQRIRAVLAEVSNTFGEHHNYFVAHEDARPIEPGDVLNARKVFHVSPFFPVRGEYRFQFGLQGRELTVGINYIDSGMRVLTTRLAGRIEPLTAKRLWRAWLACPAMSFGVIARIHWQALKLLAKRVPFLGSKPLPIAQDAS